VLAYSIHPESGQMLTKWLLLVQKSRSGYAAAASVSGETLIN
jgi:hypothetical protein